MQNNYQTSQYYTNNISYDLNENNNIMNNNISPIQYDNNVKYIDTNNERGSNNEIMPTQIGILQHKLASKKTKIKNIKSNITMLIEENQRIKKRIAELEAHFEEIEINTKKYISSENDTIDNEKELLNKISILENSLKIKNEQISKMEKIEELKLRDMEMLDQKCKDLEIIMEENQKEFAYKNSELIKENSNFKEKMNELDKMFELFNFFIKRISNIFPSFTNHTINFDNSKVFQNELIYLENCIINLNQQKDQLINKLKNTQAYQSSINVVTKEPKTKTVNEIEEKIKQITEENLKLEKKLKKSEKNNK